MYSHKCEVLGKTRALDGEDPGAAGADGGQERPTGRKSAGAVPVERGVELTLQLLALEGATPMWPKFQHFAVDIPGTTEKQSA